MKKELVIAAVTSCLGSIAPAADLQGTPQVPAGLLACSNIHDSAERVRCYDAQVAAMQKAGKGAKESASPSSAAPVPGPAQAPAPVPAPASGSTAAPANVARPAPGPSSSPPARSAGARFGEEELPFAQPPKSRHAEETLSSSITGVTKGAPGIYYFSLANGQVWRADGSRMGNSSVIALLFRVGDPIRIERGALGSYHMSAPASGAKNWMYVRRVR